ncbi:hypothetical protein GQ53DRAFT_760922 [Thozetella sp. PMI_491]|nr:hypothetical protein GQ53DRAFT_760922 [Thozetella sp. PMI_491]
MAIHAVKHQMGSTICAERVVVSSSGILIIGGTDTVTIPTVTAPTTLTTDGETFTFFPPSATSGNGGPVTITESDGQVVVSSSGVIIIGSDTISVPNSLTSPTTITTDGETFTFLPPSTTDGETFTFFPPSQPSTTLAPASTTSIPPPPTGPITFTEPDGQTVVISSGQIIIGSDTFSFPSVDSLTTLTTDGETFTLRPPGDITHPANPTSTSPDEDHDLDLIPCIIPPLPICIPCVLAPQGCFPPDIATPTIPSLTRQTTTGCKTSTVTDFFVLCSTDTAKGTRTCTTTRTQPITGCSVTPTTTTTTKTLATCALDAPNTGFGFAFGPDGPLFESWTLPPHPVELTLTNGLITTVLEGSGIASWATLTPSVTLFASPTTATPTSTGACESSSQTIQGNAVLSVADGDSAIVISLPFADVSGTSWTATVGGGFSVQPKDLITTWAVSNSGGSLASGNGGDNIAIAWTNSNGGTGTVLTLFFQQFVAGTKSFGISFSGSVPCTLPPASSASAAPTPTGGFWLGEISGGGVTVVGDVNTTCDHIVFAHDNVAEFQVEALDQNGNQVNPGSNVLIGTQPFSLEAIQFPAGFPSPCHFDDMVLSFTPDANNGNLLTHPEHRFLYESTESFVDIVQHKLPGYRLRHLLYGTVLAL